VRARRRSHVEARTDALTGLGNRRKLFTDLERIVAAAQQNSLSIGIFDLDRFKSYNDAFGHPAGDALLARLGGRLSEAVDGKGSAYRIGGDEFVVLATNNNLSVLHDAQAALSEHGEGFSVGCSFGTTTMDGDTTPEEALHLADLRLYTNKRTAHGGEPPAPRRETIDALLQVLTEQDNNLAIHLGHVAELAASTAGILGLPDEQIRQTRLAAELHDVGKAAIPGSILNKPGPLTSAERLFIERHSEIGEQIVAAAHSLQAIAPIVRSAHERLDGTGYPDGLEGAEIPICSRIIAVVDAYDAMTSDRPYRNASSETDALIELRRCAGTQFDPPVVEAFATALAERSVQSVKAAEEQPRSARTAFGAADNVVEEFAWPGRPERTNPRIATGLRLNEEAGATGLEPATFGFGDRRSTN
jgi:two-component system, cell cycle response regulator